MLFVLGWLVALVLFSGPLFVYALIRGRRAFHADGPVCRAEVIALDDVIGPRLAGPALVRFSGAFRDEGARGSDILGMAVRLRHAGDPADDPRIGDQDILFGTFETFHTALADMEHVDVGDYLGRPYAAVSRWKVKGLGVRPLRAVPPPPADPARADSRLGRLDADIAAGRAVLVLTAPEPVAELRLVERTTLDGRQLRMSMFRTERGIHPVGFRNGVRALLYPLSQTARRLRGG